MFSHTFSSSFKVSNSAPFVCFCPGAEIIIRRYENIRLSMKDVLYCYCIEPKPFWKLRNRSIWTVLKKNANLVDITFGHIPISSQGIRFITLAMSGWAGGAMLRRDLMCRHSARSAVTTISVLRALGRTARACWGLRPLFNISEYAHSAAWSNSLK